MKLNCSPAFYVYLFLSFIILIFLGQNVAKMSNVQGKSLSWTMYAANIMLCFLSIILIVLNNLPLASSIIILNGLLSCILLMTLHFFDKENVTDNKYYNASMLGIILMTSIGVLSIDYTPKFGVSSTGESGEVQSGGHNNIWKTISLSGNNSSELGKISDY